MSPDTPDSPHPESGEGPPLTSEQKRALLAKLLRESRDPASAAIAEPAPSPLALTPGQERLWETETHDAVQNFHCFALLYTIRGPLDAARLEAAVHRVAEQHPLLRVRIGTDQGSPRFEPCPLPEPLVPLRVCSTEPDVEEAVREEAGRSLDLNRGVGWRCVLLREGPELHHLLVQVHHIVADRWSLAVFITDLGAAYAAQGEGRPPFPSPGKAGGDPPAGNLPRSVPSPENAWDGQLDFWRRRYTAPAAPTRLPLAGIPSGPDHIGARLETGIGGELYRVVRDFAETRGATPFPVLFAALAASFAARGGSREMVICTPVSGRHRSETRKSIGYFNNILPVQVEVNRSDRFEQLVARVVAELRDVYTHQDVPFHVICALPGLRRVRLTRCLFTFQNVPGLTLNIPGTRTTYRDVPNGTADFDLSMFAEARGDAVTLLTDYKLQVFDGDSAALLVRGFLKTLEKCLSRPDAPLGDCLTWEGAATGAAEREASPLAAPATPPATPMERELLALWSECFGQHNLSVEDDFFALGGDSMQAFILFARIREVLGVELPLATLFEAPTVRRLATRLEDRHWQAPWESLIPVRAEGSRPPLFLVAGGGGNVVSFRRVADHLDEDQPVYCLQSRGLREEDEPLESVEAMAEHYLESIRRLRPHGPYLLGGHSLGALVSYEMARRLLQDGETVPLLLILDHHGPGIRLNRFDWTRYHLYNLAMLSFRERLEYLRSAVRFRYRAWRNDHRPRRPATTASPAGPEDTESIRVRLVGASLRAVRNYRIDPYDGSLVLFRARAGNPRIRSDRYGGWNGVVRGGVMVHEVPGTHMDMLKEPHVAELGRLLGTLLREGDRKLSPRHHQ